MHRGNVHCVGARLETSDKITIEEYYRLENQSEDKINRVREPAAAVARKLLE
jgi:hypothetical protein